MEIRIGAPVLATDGQTGTVERIILHPETSEVEGVVAIEGRLLTRDVVIPIDWVEAAGEDGVHVRATAEQIDGLEPFAQSQYTEPPEDWLPPSGQPAAYYLFPASPLLVGAFPPATMQPGAPPPEEVENLEEGDVQVSGSTAVFCTDGECGRLDRVVTEGDSDRVLFLVIRDGSRDLQVPVTAVESMGEAGIRLRLSKRDLGDLPAVEAA